MAGDVHVRFPFRLDATGHVGVAHYSDHVREMIEQVLFTSPGERVNRPEFGAGAQTPPFEPLSRERVAAMEVLMRSVLHRWLGDVIIGREVEITETGSGVEVHVSYIEMATGAARDVRYTSF